MLEKFGVITCNTRKIRWRRRTIICGIFKSCYGKERNSREIQVKELDSERKMKNKGIYVLKNVTA